MRFRRRSVWLVWTGSPLDSVGLLEGAFSSKELAEACKAELESEDLLVWISEEEVDEAA